MSQMRIYIYVPQQQHYYIWWNIPEWRIAFFWLEILETSFVKWPWIDWFFPSLLPVFSLSVFSILFDAAAFINRFHMGFAPKFTCKISFFLLLFLPILESSVSNKKKFLWTKKSFFFKKKFHFFHINPFLFFFCLFIFLSVCNNAKVLSSITS